MKPIRALFLAVLLLGTGTAMAGGYYGHGHGHGHGPRASFGFYFGPSWYSGYYPAPYYYPPNVVYVQPAPTYTPPVYVEQSPATTSNSYWYFCQASNAYYPQVGECPAGWIRVAPR